MDRRDSIKALVMGTVSAGVILEACETADKKTTTTESKAGAAPETNADRMQEEIVHNKKLQDEKFFTAHEMATIAMLSDIIIPKDDVSGSATDAKVPDFIEFIVKDQPHHQVPMRGGLRWLDLKCMNLYEKPFTDCTGQQKTEIVDNIAYPDKVKPEFKPGANFFSLVRNLTVTGFYSSEIGTKDVGYLGNKPNQWNGVPGDVLKQYNMEYTAKELKECISYDKA